MTPTDYSKIYTDAPEQHPNLIVGSLQLLFWVIFRPSAWGNHLNRIDSALLPNSDTGSRLRWQNPALIRLLIQVYLVLPLLVNLTVGLMLLVLVFGVSVINFGFLVSIGMGLGVVISVAVVFVSLNASSLAFGMMCSSILPGVLLSLLWLLDSPWIFPSDVVSLFVLGLGIMFGVTLNVQWSVSGIAFDEVFTAALFMMLVLLLRTSLVMLGVGVTINFWRPVILYPLVTLWNTLLYELDQGHTDIKLSLLRWHSAFWDEWQQLPLYRLDKHLVLVMERNPAEGVAAIDYLITSPQRWATQAAQIELDARRLERCADVEAICKAHLGLVITELQSPVSPLLGIFRRISRDVDAAMNQESTYNQRLALNTVAKGLASQLQDLRRSDDKYVVRFYPIVKNWLEIVDKYVRELAEAVEIRQEIDNPYIIGVPLNDQLEIFIGRTSIGLRIELLLLDRRRPPLLLYGQRRMGKTSLLNNLGRLLPNTIIPMFVDLQGAPASASNHAGFLYNLAKQMVDSAKRQGALTLPSLTREALAIDPFTCFNEWLDDVEQALEQNTGLLMLDEFEVLDSAISKGRFDEQDVLGMLRNLIQHRPKFKILIAGSHIIEEYQRWASYLINVQVVHISYLKQDEARQLIEHPVKDFTLRYESDAVERVLQLTRCHPFLVQLLCGEIVALKNEQDPSVRRLATLTDVEAAVPEALSSGSFFFADIQNNQVDAAGLAILRLVAAQGEGAIASRSTMLQKLPNVSESAFELLLQRELIEEVGDGFRFQVELIRRWFAQ